MVNELLKSFNQLQAPMSVTGVTHPQCACFPQREHFVLLSFYTLTQLHFCYDNFEHNLFSSRHHRLIACLATRQLVACEREFACHPVFHTVISVYPFVCRYFPESARESLTPNWRGGWCVNLWRKNSVFCSVWLLLSALACVYAAAECFLRDLAQARLAFHR